MATIYDVAKRAGVSPKTVSRVLNGDAPVNARTRDTVNDAIGALGYVPSSAARAMRSNRSGLIGIITGAISSSPSSNELSGLPELVIVQSIQKTLSEAGLIPLIVDTGGSADTVPDLMRTLAEHRVEAQVFVADCHRCVELPAIHSRRATLLVNCFDTEGTPCVLPDDKGGQQALVAALIDAGHTRIAYLTLPEELVAYRERVAGYRDALEAASLPFDEALVCAAGLHRASAQEALQIGEAVDRLMALDEPPTVICCGNDRMAIQLYGVLRSKGYAVPDDVSVAGYDDYRVISETLYPPLTTTVLPYEDMGTQAAKLLLANLREGSALPEVPVIVSGPVVWRQSVTDTTSRVSSRTTDNPGGCP